MAGEGESCGLLVRSRLACAARAAPKTSSSRSTMGSGMPLPIIPRLGSPSPSKGSLLKAVKRPGSLTVEHADLQVKDAH
jgi:hypothetical protein